MRERIKVDLSEWQIFRTSMVAMEDVAAMGFERRLVGDPAVLCALLPELIEETDITAEDFGAGSRQGVADGVVALPRTRGCPSRSNLRIALGAFSSIPETVRLADRITDLYPGG